MARRVTKLELHRAKFIKDGCTGPLLIFSSLEPEEKELLRKVLARQIGSSFSNSEDGLPINLDEEFFLVLSDWGVMCVHPQNRREYLVNGSKTTSGLPLKTPQWYSCSTCGCIVLNEEYYGVS